MAKKKFSPQITRIKLTPEQAVLTCCALPGRGLVVGGQQCTSNGGCGSMVVNATSS